MPLFVYECVACKCTIELFVRSIHEEREVPCPECGANSKKVIAKTSFQLKGPGWSKDAYQKS